MRSAEQIGRTVGEWHDYQRAERCKHLDELLRMLTRARETHEPWYRWIEQRIKNEHSHGDVDERGKPMACPVRGCGA